MEISERESRLKKEFLEIANNLHLKILCVGAGATGSQILKILGKFSPKIIEKIVIIDDDIIDASNLARQEFTEKEVGQPKATAMKNHLLENNSELRVIAIKKKIESENDPIFELEDFDIIIDAVDNLKTRIILSKSALPKKIPILHMAISFDGFEYAILDQNTACFGCLYNKHQLKEEEKMSFSCATVKEHSIVTMASMCASHSANLMFKYFMQDYYGDFHYYMYTYDAKKDDEIFKYPIIPKESCNICNPIIKETDIKKYNERLRIFKEKDNKIDLL